MEKDNLEVFFLTCQFFYGLGVLFFKEQ